MIFVILNRYMNGVGFHEKDPFTGANIAEETNPQVGRTNVQGTFTIYYTAKNIFEITTYNLLSRVIPPAFTPSCQVWFATIRTCV